MRETYIDYFNGIAEQYWQADLGSDERSTFASILSNLYALAPRFAYSIGDLDVMLGEAAERVSAPMEVVGLSPALAEIPSCGQVVVGPENLRPVIINILLAWLLQALKWYR